MAFVNFLSTSFLLTILVMVWVYSIHRKLVILDENVNHAMGQVCLQLSSRLCALTTLLHLAMQCGCADATLLHDAGLYRSMAPAAPADVIEQEQFIQHALYTVTTAACHCEALRSSPNYQHIVETADSYAKVLYTSQLIYNDSVTKLNRYLRTFPNMMVGTLLGFYPKDYLALEDCDPFY